MLRASYAPMVTDQDQLIFDMLIPSNHYLRQVNALVDFEQYRAAMAVCYHATDGRPADDPVVILKIGFLQTHYNLSDVRYVRRKPSLHSSPNQPHPCMVRVRRRRPKRHVSVDQPHLVSSPAERR